jgi:adenylosuccinate lyase
MDQQNALRAISPLDGRYGSKLFDLSTFFSEYGLFKYRLHIEVEYLIALEKLSLPQIPTLADDDVKWLRSLVNDFTVEESLLIKAHEKVTNHDVKALEYYLHDKLQSKGLGELQPWVHFCLTSQDINNTAIPLSIKDFIHKNYLPLIQNFIHELSTASTLWANIPMLARTHGQPASPTRLGKEMQVFVERLKKQINMLSTIEFEGKFGGATGNFNAHYVAFPRVDWVSFANDFLAELGLKRQQTTTQIEHYDGLAEVFDTLTRINTILLDFCRDMWSYISFNYFKLSLKEGEVGSSAMPHKVNPIDFENAEGNIGIANALYIHMATKLPVSRLQRDLSDSTVLRSVGVPMGHSVLALKSAIRGIQKCTPNTEVIEGELNNTAVVIAEAYQVILRREGVANGYEIIKAVTRTNAKPSLEDMQAIIDQLPVNEAIKVEMRAITPQNYTGI